MRTLPILAAWALATPLLAQYARPALTSPSVATTRQDNIITTWAEIPVSPLKLILKGNGAPIEYTGVVNVRRGRIELYYFNATANQHFLVAEMPIPVGATTAVVRPNTAEIWIAVPNSRIGIDPATSTPSDGGSVVIVDSIKATAIRSIAVGINPSGIAFHPSGSHAYVSCRGSRDVHVVDCTTGVSVGSVGVDQYTPHAIAYLPATNEVKVAALLSGNNSVTRGTFAGDESPDLIVDATADPNVVGNLPDRDVVTLAVNPTNPALLTQVPAKLATGVMTTQFQITADPTSTKVFVVGMSSLNTQFVGEKNFVGGRVVENQLVVLDYVGGGAPTPTVLDLDVLPFAPMAAPTDFVVAPNGRRGWLIARGVDRVVEFNLTGPTPTPVGAWDLIPGTTGYSATRVGARSAAVDPTGSQLAVYCEIENSFAILDVSGAAPTTPISVRTVPLRFDPLPNFAKNGWSHLSDAARSLSQTSSCYSCHIDGGTDNLAWQLSKFHDPEGTPTNQLQHIEDFKSPMQTQVLFGLTEVGPFHWRGEQRTLADFNGAFSGLLEAPELNPAELSEMIRFIDLMRHAPNRHLAMNRSYAASVAPAGTGSVGQGLIDFESFPVYAPVNPTASCASCHTLPTGTNNEIQLTPVGPPSFFVKVAPLRGVVNRLDAPINLGSFVGNRCSNGSGLVHHAQIGSFLEFVQQPEFPGLAGQPAVQDNLVAFMDCMDTGLAPSTSLVCVLRTDYANPGLDYDTTMAFVKAESNAGHADFSIHIAIPTSPTTFLSFPGFWDRNLQAFVFQSQTFGLQTELGMRALFLAVGEPLTFLGHPPGTGHRWGIDADDDELLDIDEMVTFGTNAFDFDSDNDNIPDGHEVRFPPSTPDTQSPTFTSGPTVMYTTTNTVKVEFTTNEPTVAIAVAQITVAGVPFAPYQIGQSSPLAGGFSLNHQIVMSNIPDQFELALFGFQLITLAIEIRAQDPAGNPPVVAPLPFTMEAGGQFSCRVQDIQNAAYLSGTNQATFQVSLGLGSHEFPLPLAAEPTPNTPTWQVECELSYGTQPGGAGTQILGLTRIGNPFGSTTNFKFQATITPTTNPATFTVGLPASAATDTNRVLAIRVVSVTPLHATPGAVYLETEAYKRNHAVLGF
ncbi:MAG: YncE family protein [Planctomycetota bacterium]